MFGLTMWILTCLHFKKIDCSDSIKPICFIRFWNLYQNMSLKSMKLNLTTLYIITQLKSASVTEQFNSWWTYKLNYRNDKKISKHANNLSKWKMWMKRWGKYSKRAENWKNSFYFWDLERQLLLTKTQPCMDMSPRPKAKIGFGRLRPSKMDHLDLKVDFFYLTLLDLHQNSCIFGPFYV